MIYNADKNDFNKLNNIPGLGENRICDICNKLMKFLKRYLKLKADIRNEQDNQKLWDKTKLTIEMSEEKRKERRPRKVFSKKEELRIFQNYR